MNTEEAIAIPDVACLWAFRGDTGHVLVAHPSLDPVSIESFLVGLERDDGPARYFWVDAGDISELTDVEEACFVLEDRVRDLRYASRAA